MLPHDRVDPAAAVEVDDTPPALTVRGGERVHRPAQPFLHHGGHIAPQAAWRPMPTGPDAGSLEVPAGPSETAVHPAGPRHPEIAADKPAGKAGHSRSLGAPLMMASTDRGDAWTPSEV